jgi:RimJ/RimL family protein N-acetyltransferase
MNAKCPNDEFGNESEYGVVSSFEHSSFGIDSGIRVWEFGFSMPLTNDNLGQPIGPALPNWAPPPVPRNEIMSGRFCRLEPLDWGRHGNALFAAYQLDTSGQMWTYLPYGPFLTADDYRNWMQPLCGRADPQLFAIIESKSQSPVGVAAYLRIDTSNGAIEIGHLAYSPRLQKTPVATEAIFLMIDRVFKLGYRRCEWKCDSLNAPSRSAAQRLGFLFEGIFRQAVVYKGRSRDTAWFSIIDSDWAWLQMAFHTWLSSDNFDVNGRQRLRLSDLTASGRTTLTR